MRRARIRDPERAAPAAAGASPEFRALLARSTVEITELLRSGGRVEPGEVARSTWRGWNLNPLFALLRSRKFLKRFHPVDTDGRVWGENVLARQDAPERPWRARLRGRGILPFVVLPPGAGPHPVAPAQALVISYGGWPGRGRLNPVGRVVDHLVRPDAARADLLLGESLFLVGPRPLLLEHFVLERER